MKSFRIAGIVVVGLMTVGLTVALTHEHEVKRRSPRAGEPFTQTARASSLGPAVGACCWDWESCCQLDDNECAQRGGRFRAGQVCGPDVCQYGACCLPGGWCMQGVETACNEWSGIFKDVGTDCHTVSCPWGACCYDGADGGGCVMHTEESCPQWGGVFRGPYTKCDDVVCTGACCVFSESCIENVTDRSCNENLGGVFQGYGTTCADARTTCKTVTGACCLASVRGFGVLGAAGANPAIPGIEACPPLQDTAGSVPLTTATLPRLPAPPAPRPPTCVEVTAFECSAYSGMGALYHGDGSTCNAVNCSRISCPSSGDCCRVHRSPGCEDETCCAEVCKLDLYCCTRGWDSACVRRAAELCLGCENLGDLDDSGTVDLEDYSILQRKFTGP